MDGRLVLIALCCATGADAYMSPASRHIASRRPRIPAVALEITGGKAAGALASSALLAEGVQFAGTAAALASAQQLFGATNPVETIGALIDYVQSLGPAGYGLYAATMIFLQVFPIANAFVLVVAAGAVFGVPEATALVVSCSTASATISFLLARHFARDLVASQFSDSKEFVALDTAFGEASFEKTLTLVTLLRVSPIIPFAWGNYIFGISPLPVGTFALGTMIGCAPGVAAVVSAGSAGAEIAASGLGSDGATLGLGIAATVGAITVAGNIATEALKEAGLDIQAD